MTSKTLAVYRKELIDTLRDGRSIFAIFIFPFIMYPAMLFFTSWMANKDDQEAKLLQVKVGVVGASAIPFVMDSLAAMPGVTPVSLASTPASIEESGVNAVLVIPSGINESLARGDSARVELLYKRANNTSDAAADRVAPILDQVQRALTVSWATSHGAHTDAPPPFVVEKKDISLKADMGRFIAALIIPYLLIFMVTAGAMQTAIDCTTGEKERSTLETILATSASRTEIVLGKCMAVLTAALTGATTGIFGLWLSFSVIAKAMPMMTNHSLEIAIGADKAILIYLTLLPTAVFLTAVLVAIGCFARSMREGQTYATYVYMSAVFLGLGSFGQQTPPMKNFFIPILNTALLQREILTNSVQPMHAMAAVGVTTAAAVVMVIVAIRLFSNEAVLFRT
ncbi:MAG: ABC transporter permease [Candidatus Eiseniibacteriota bacterium]